MVAHFLPAPAARDPVKTTGEEFKKQDPRAGKQVGKNDFSVSRPQQGLGGYRSRRRGITFFWNPGKLVGPEVPISKETGMLMGTLGCLVCTPEQGRPLVYFSRGSHQIAWSELLPPLWVLAPQVKTLSILSLAGSRSHGHTPFAHSKVMSPCRALSCVLHVCKLI